MLPLDEVKRNIGKEAAKRVQNGMLVGLGTGTTAKEVIAALALRIREGLDIRVVATSKVSEAQAKAAGFTFADIETVTSIDMTLDGADEITPDGDMIKGRGGALLREKIIASMSKEMCVLVDETKCVETLGRAPLPVEVTPFGRGLTYARIESLGYKPTFRKGASKELYITDGGNLIIDLEGVKSLAKSTREQHLDLIQIPGVVETGFFFDLATSQIIGHRDGVVEKSDF